MPKKKIKKIIKKEKKPVKKNAVQKKPVVQKKKEDKRKSFSETVMDLLKDFNKGIKR